MQSAIRFELCESLLEVAPASWDALHDGHPALAHAFLTSLEKAGCVGPHTGWLPRYLLGYRGKELLAAAPLYMKGHSYGEYVFDWAWADAYRRHGLDYYPKWLVASPFSPLPGSRLLGVDDETRRAALHALLQLARQSGLSSLHILFASAQECEWMREEGLLVREGVQFHWQSRGEADFDGFLARLNHDKRKKIRQERRKVAGYGLDYRWLDGHEATGRDWEFFMRCYEDTYRAHLSTPYLNAAFFDGIARGMPDAVRLLIAEREREAVASAFFLTSRGRLYGRYWGCRESLPGLHFELCYYRPIDYCIEGGLTRLEGGAQGEHKLSRGLEPVVTGSGHWIADARFRDAIDRHLSLEASQMTEYREDLRTRSPFRRGPAGS